MERPLLTRKFVMRFLTIFSIFLIVLLAVSLPIIGVLSRQVEEQNSELYRKNMTISLETMDSQVQTVVEQMQDFCIASQNFASLCNPLIELDYLGLRDMRQEMSPILRNYELVKDAVLLTRNDLIFTQNRSIANRSGLPDIFFEQMFVTERIPSPQAARELGKAAFCAPIYTLDGGSYQSLIITRPIYNGDAYPVAQLILSLDMDAVLKRIAPFPGRGEVEVIWQGETIYRESHEEPANPATLSVTAPKLGLEMRFSVPKALLHQSIQSILTAIWLLFAAAFMGGLALTAFFLVDTGRPMRKLMQLVRPAMESATMEDAVTHLSNTMQQSREEIAAQKALLQQNMLENGLTGNLSVREAQQAFDALLPHFPSRYQVALMELGSGFEGGADYALAERVMIEHMLSAQFTQVIYFVPIYTHTVALVVPDGAGGIEALESLQEAFQKKYQIPVNICVSAMVSGTAALSEAYADAKHIQNCASSYIEKRVWHRGNFPAQNHISMLDYTVYQQLYEALSAGQKEQALGHLKHLFQTLPNPTAPTASANKRTLAFAHSVLTRVKFEQFELLSHIPMAQPDMSLSIEDYQRMMESYVLTLCEAIKQKTVTSFSEEIVDWVDEHFTDAELYQKTVTVHFNITEKALQAAIHEQAGCSFAEYLEKKRIDMACRLLKQTELSVKDIGEKSGFALYNTFYKAFKRHLGISPLEYRAR